MSKNFKEVCDRVVHDSDLAIITRAVFSHYKGVSYYV